MLLVSDYFNMMCSFNYFIRSVIYYAFKKELEFNTNLILWSYRWDMTMNEIYQNW